MKALVPVLALVVITGCRERAPVSKTSAPLVSDVTVTVVAAGDIAGPWPEDTQTAELTERLSPAAVLLLGDLVYPAGAPEQYESFYRPSWGRFADKAFPAPGNHDHGTALLRGYCDVFGERAHCQDGFAWYAFDLGAWRVLSLDSGGKEPGSSLDPMRDGAPQRAWLEHELKRDPRRCTLVFWHHPRFSSGEHGDDVRSQKIWEQLHDAGVDLVLNGHDHHYERFVPMNAKGERDDKAGITSIIVGTGGAPLYPFTREASATTVIRQADTHGVLKLSLQPTGFSWAFVPVPGKSFSDSGHADCH